MMHSVFSLTLVLVLIYQPVLAGAQDARLRQFLQDLPHEVTRYLAELPEARHHSSSSGGSDVEEVDLARLRARIRNLPHLAHIQIVVRGGQQFDGQLVEATSEDFALSIEVESRVGRLKKRVRYESVDSFVLPESNGWLPVERIQNIKEGKRVEVLFVDDTKVKGRFSSATADVLTLDMGKGRARDFALDEVASIRNQGLQRGVQIAIIGGAIFGGLSLLAYASYAACSC